MATRPKAEEINALLDAVRNRQTIIDVPLADVLENGKFRADRKRATSLVSQVQRHYERVRAASLRDVRTPGKTLETAIDRIQQFDNNIALNKSSTAPSRPSSA